MRIDEAKAALERAGYDVRLAMGVVGISDGTPPTDPGPCWDVEGLATAVTETELIKLAHRHGAWRPAFERAHRAGPSG